MAEQDHSVTLYERAAQLILRAFRSLPNGLKVLVLSIVLVALGVLAYYKFSKPEKAPDKPLVTIQNFNGSQVVQNPPSPLPGAPKSIQSSQSDEIYTEGVPDSHKKGSADHDPQNIEANHAALEDALAAKFHLENNKAADMREQSILESDQDNYIHYKFFKVDRCIFLNRREAGINHWQWIKDPLYHLHDAHELKPTKSQSNADNHPDVPARNDQLALATDAQFAKLWESHPSSKAHVVEIRATLDPPLEAVQGSCLNPHPGQFRYWWGGPLDQCNSPMFRQFADGCTHYQIYNRCANAWDGRIFWTACAAYHSY